MSNSPELIPVPAYEMLKVLYQPEKALEVAKSMTPEEKKVAISIMNFCHERKEKLAYLVSSSSRDALDDKLLRQRNLMRERLHITENILSYCRYLGYDPLAIMESIVYDVNSSKLLLSW